MYAQVEKSKENKSRMVANPITQKRSDRNQGIGLVDNRAEVITQRKLQEVANNETQMRHTRPNTIQRERSGVTQFLKSGLFNTKESNHNRVNNTKVVQRQLTFSGPADEIQHAFDIINEAYVVGLPQGQNAQLALHIVGEDNYGQPKFEIREVQRPEIDGIGSHLIGKIIEDGNVNLYFGEFNNDARPTDPAASARGESSEGEVLLVTGATPIQLIHELIHTYHFDFDPWNTTDKAENVPIESQHGVEQVSAEEASTVGLGQWADFELTENAFRRQMGLERRDRYGD